jgi:hypothetical protein
MCKGNFSIFIIIICLQTLSFTICFGQPAGKDSLPVSGRYKNWIEKNIEIIGGFHWQGSSQSKTLRYVEIGLAKTKHYFGYHGPASFALYVSEEMYFGEQTNIWGTKIGAWTHYLFDLGLSLVYYTDFEKGNFKIRPEIGVGMGRLRIVGGYNIPTIENRAFKELRKNTLQATIQFMVPVKKKVLKYDE